MNFVSSYQKNPNFPNRYISPLRLEKFLRENLSDSISEVGTSSLGKSIYMMSMGTGSIKVLAWSQMHGNESNATHAMLDMLETFKHAPLLKKELFSKITLDFIFMLNPDGSEKWERRNAMEIDMNRDFHKLSSKEFPVLKKIAQTGGYMYGLNLHEQRTIFTTDGTNPATLSFLAPSVNFERELTETRKKAMAVIVKIFERMKDLLPTQIGRYSDEFYPTSAGDNFTKMGLPTILYEGGHFADDYLRVESRKYYTVALYEGLKAISELNGDTLDYDQYFQIPENIESHYDLIYRNVSLNTDFECILDIAVQYREVYMEGENEISFIPIVAEVGDCGRKKGWKEVDCTGKLFKSDSKYPKIDEEVKFEII